MTSYTVILVEDEVLIRMMVAEILLENGFTVIEAAHSDAALATLQARADQIHLLFTDIHMPGRMDGLALAHHARTHWPWIKALLASGRAHPPEHRLPKGSRFMAKPYLPDEMISLVQDLLARG